MIMRVFILAVLCFFLPLLSHAEESRIRAPSTVLFISSTSSVSRAMAMQEAFLSRWKEREPEVQVLFYLLSAYTFPLTSRDYSLIRDSLAERLKDRPLSLITAWADPSLVLALSLRDSSFPSTPIIAFDIAGDEKNRAKYEGRESLYVVEMGDFGPKTVGLAKTLFPEKKRAVILLTMGTELSRVEGFRKRYDDLFPDLELIVCVNPSQKSADPVLRASPKESFIVNFCPGWVDRTGRFLAGKDFTNSLVETYGLPEFEYIREFMDKGMTGGFGIPVETWGKNVAEQGLSLVLDGKKPPAWSAAMSLANAFVDCTQLLRFGSSLSRIPPGAELVNAPPSLWVRYQGFLQPFLVLLVTALAGSVLLAAVKRRERKILLEANASLEREVEERTSDLRKTNEELEASNSNLVTAIRRTEEMQENVLRSAREITLGRFAAGMANGLNSPLNAASSASSALRSLAAGGEEGLATVLFSLDEGQRALFFRHAPAVLARRFYDEVAQEGSASFEAERRLARLFPDSEPALTADLADAGLAGLSDADLADFAAPGGQAVVRALYLLAVLVRSTWIIDESVGRAVEVVKTVREYVRDSETETAPGPVNLRTTLERSLLLFKNRLLGSIELRTAFDEVPPVRGSEPAFVRIWAHLIQNALQAMPSGGRLDILLQREGAFAVVSVGDEGEGIDPSVEDRLFEPFVTTRPLAEGMGLGLAYCKRSIEALGGGIEFSRKDRGTVFRVLLPLGGTA